MTGTEILLSSRSRTSIVLPEELLRTIGIVCLRLMKKALKNLRSRNTMQSVQLSHGRPPQIRNQRIKVSVIVESKTPEKTIRAQKKNLESYNKYLERIAAGKTLKRYNGEIITAEEVQGWIENAEEIIDQAISKSVYYHECLEELGGVAFSKENIKPGYIIKIKRYGRCEVISAGKVNITYRIIEGGASGCTLKAAYAEIEKIISTEVSEEEIEHPFKVGEKFTVSCWNGGKIRAERICDYEGNAG